MMSEQKKPSPHTQAVASMFAAYGQAADYQRMAVYVKMLKDFPVGLVEKAVDKVLLENKFLPSISEFVAACNSLVETVDDSRRIKSWDEAWKEIQKQMQDAFIYQKPVFSTPEIAQAVQAFGWIPLCETLVEDMPTVRAQVRRFYEDACARSREKRSNARVLGISEEPAIEAKPAAAELDDADAVFARAYELLYGKEQNSPAKAIEMPRQDKYTPDDKKRQEGANPFVREAIKRLANGMNLDQRNGEAKNG